jgi:uncharacterized membrane protein
MNYNRKRWISVTAELTLGAVLMGLNLFGVIEDWWGSFGCALLIVGVANLVRVFRYRNSESYREKVDISNKDERLRYLSMKAWAWAGYFFVFLCGSAVIVFRILGNETASMWTAWGVCLLITLYWVCYFFLSKKY